MRFYKLLILFLFVSLLFVVYENNSIKKLHQKNFSVSKISNNPFQDKHWKDKISDYLTLKENYSTRFYFPTEKNNNWVMWFKPNIRISENDDLRVQVKGKDDYISFINIEIHLRLGSKTYSKEALQAVVKIYNFLFPEWKDDGFLHKNFSKLIDEKSIWITRDDIVFHFRHYSDSDINVMQVIIKPN